MTLGLAEVWWTCDNCKDGIVVGGYPSPPLWKCYACGSNDRWVTDGKEISRQSSQYSRSDGGPAFPSHGTMGEVNSEGMTLQAWFAGHALGSLLNESLGTPENKAAQAVAYANALIAELNK